MGVCALSGHSPLGSHVVCLAPAQCRRACLKSAKPKPKRCVNRGSMERTFLNRYQAIRLLGEGGMGRVYLAKQLDLGRQVVVKVMHDNIASDPKFRDRFQRETLLMAKFQHPYAVTLYDASLNDPEGPCIVMEYIRGITLDEVLRKNGRLSPGRVGRLLG